MRSTLILLQTLLGAVAAASTFSNHLLDSPVVLLLMPGMVAAIALSGNVHAFPIWVAACGNFLFYFFLLWLVPAVWKKSPDETSVIACFIALRYKDREVRGSSRFYT